MKKLARLLFLGGLLALVGWAIIAGLGKRHTAGPATPAPNGAATDATIGVDGRMPIDLGNAGYAERVAADGGFEGLIVCVVDDITDAPVGGASVLLSDSFEEWSAHKASGTTVGTPAGRRISRQLQRELITGVDGCVAYTTCPEPCTIEARAGNRWGNATLEAVPVNRRVTVRLAEDTAVRVRVVSLYGVPRAGVPVALRRSTNAYPPFHWSLTETEEPDGVATFEHHQLRLRRGEGWRFAFGFPVIGDPTVVVDPAAAEQELPVLVLEGAGKLLIRARDSQGNPPHGTDLSVRLSAFDDARGGAELSQGGPWSVLPLTPDGEASAPWIGLGLRLRVEVLQEEATRGEAAALGPSREGEIVECDVQLDDPRLLRGRLVFRDGLPWISESVAAIVGPVLRRSAKESSYNIWTDAAGRFCFPITEKPSPGTPCMLRLSGMHPKTHTIASANITFESMPPPGGLDLGDVVLDHGPRLVSGRVIDEAGRPICRAACELHLPDELKRTASEDYINAFRRTVAPGGYSELDGSFALFRRTEEEGLATGTSLSLTTRHPDYGTDEGRLVRIGQSQVEIVLARAGSIEGTLDLCEGVGIADLELELTSDAGRRYSLEPKAKLFTFRCVAEGTYLLRVRPRMALHVPGLRPFVEIPNLQVCAGTVCRDARLQPLRVEDDRVLATVRVVDDSSAPIRNAWVIARGKMYYRTPPQTNDDGLCALRLDSVPVQAEVGAVGFRKRYVSIADGETCVVLEPGVMTRFYTSAQIVGSDPAYRLSVQLFEVDATGMRGAAAIRMGPNALDVLESGRGGAPVALSPGTYECVPRIKVFRVDRAVEGPVTLVSYPRITVRESQEEQRCEIDIRQAEVDAAVAQYNSKH